MDPWSILLVARIAPCRLWLSMPCGNHSFCCCQRWALPRGAYCCTMSTVKGGGGSLTLNADVVVTANPCLRVNVGTRQKDAPGTREVCVTLRALETPPITCVRVERVPVRACARGRCLRRRANGRAALQFMIILVPTPTAENHLAVWACKAALVSILTDKQLCPASIYNAELTSPPTTALCCRTATTQPTIGLLSLSVPRDGDLTRRRCEVHTAAPWVMLVKARWHRQHTRALPMGLASRWHEEWLIPSVSQRRLHHSLLNQQLSEAQLDPCLVPPSGSNDAVRWNSTLDAPC